MSDRLRESGRRWLAAGAVLALAAAPLPTAWALDLKPDHPERYTVVEGDTLWDIANRFLKEPWRWPELWKSNPQIKNPDLIYPGDVLVLTVAEGRPALKLLRRQRLAERPTVKLSPAVYSQPIPRPIPTIPMRAIRPFLKRPLVVEADVLKRAGYVTVGVDDKLVLGKFSRFYARRLGKNPAERYHIFRPGKVFRHPQTREVLGHEAVYLGAARLLAAGETAKLEIVHSEQEIGPRDRLLPVPKEEPLPPFYQPRAPSEDLQGWVLSAIGGLSEVGPNTIVAISLGARDGLEVGHVLRIMRHVGTRTDPVTDRTYSVPEEDSGLLMVFRIFEKVSYGLVLTATRSVRVMDTVRTP